MAATPAWFAAVEALLNRGISASPQAAALARRLDATVLRLDCDGLVSLEAGVQGGRLTLSIAGLSHVDAAIRGSPYALLTLARDQLGRRAQLKSNGARASVSGDAEIANGYGQLIAAALPDWEEELSRVIGDLPARHLSRLAMRAAAWARRTHRTAGENLAEYLQEEGRDLVGRYELDEFLQGVDRLRETADRVEARVTRLERRLRG